MRGYVVVFEGHDTSGYSAYSPDLPGVIAAAGTRDDTEQLIREAMAEHVAILRATGMPIPEPAYAADVSIVNPAACPPFVSLGATPGPAESPRVVSTVAHDRRPRRGGRGLQRALPTSSAMSTLARGATGAPAQPELVAAGDFDSTIVTGRVVSWDEAPAALAAPGLQPVITR